MADTLLDIVNENDEIVGKALRSEIHPNDMLHREVHVWFVTPNKEIIFQIRKPSPPMFMRPLLDATTGGHVELGHSYLQTALKEVFEETGSEIKEENLIFWKKHRIREVFVHLNKTNNVFRAVYIYPFSQNIDILKIEEGKGMGFVAIPVDDFINHASWIEEKYDIIPFLLEDKMMEFYKEISNG